MLAGKPRPLLGHSRPVPFGQLGSLQPLTWATSRRDGTRDAAKRSAELLGTLGCAKALQRPRVQGPGPKWGDPHPALSSHLGRESGNTGGRGPELDAESHRHTLLRDVWRDRTLVRGQGTWVLSAWEFLGG